MDDVKIGHIPLRLLFLKIRTWRYFFSMSFRAASAARRTMSR